ncbi:MAG TPA: type VI secretion system protein TssA [Desulfobacterales bacterium]|nr:type VI secretion system protein TssA [Desulfobacterales bacterium]
MKKTIDLEAILAPIPGDNPAGESLRYHPLYDEIQEARRADDVLDQGEWQHELKSSDWDKVFSLSMEALTTKTKDLQIAAWLFESLTITEGFAGVNLGFKIITGFLRDFWDHLYPEIDDDDLDYRVGPLEFLNDKVWLPVKQIPLTDSTTTPGYSWMKWQESRQVGSEKDIRNQYGDIDSDKQQVRDELIAEGKITAEDFDTAVAGSSRAFYETLAAEVTACLEEFKLFDAIVDEKFGREAPRLAELKTALEDCRYLVDRLLKEKREQEPDSPPEVMADETAEAPPETAENAGETPQESAAPPLDSDSAPSAAVSAPVSRVNRLLGSAGIEEAVWRDALTKLKSDGIKQALEQLLAASCTAQSVREETNFRLLTAKLCLKAGRPDLARPIAEKLNTLMDELQLSRWESPIWIAEVLDVLIQCLTCESAPDDDIYRSKELLMRLCTLDVTKAMGHMS